MSDSVTTVTSVDTAAKTYTRVRASDGRVDTLASDAPGIGFLQWSPSSDVRVVGLPLAGTGLTFYASFSTTQDEFLEISVEHP